MRLRDQAATLASAVVKAGVPHSLLIRGLRGARPQRGAATAIGVGPGHCRDCCAEAR